MEERFFTIDEANKLLPELTDLMKKANSELDKKSSKLQVLNDIYLKAEQELDECGAPEDDTDNGIGRFRKQRANFEKAINDLSKERAEFIRCLESWVDEITGKGVILRKLRDGLVDFPARNGDFKYYLCWQFGEGDITHWHLDGDGYIGRKALVSLSEYC